MYFYYLYRLILSNGKWPDITSASHYLGWQWVLHIRVISIHFPVKKSSTINLTSSVIGLETFLFSELSWKKIIEISGQFYNLTIVQNDQNDFLAEEFLDDDSKWIVADSLLNRGRGSTTIRLPFEFPFYGHNVSKIYLTTEGFISLAERIHSQVRLDRFLKRKKLYILMRQTISCGTLTPAVVVAQLADGSLPMPEVRGSNQAIF